MDYTRDSFKSIRDELEREREKKRGSTLITVLIIIIFAAAGIFYIKTSKPQLWHAAANYIKSAAAGEKSLVTVGKRLFEKAQTEAGPKSEDGAHTETENSAGESGDMLMTADNLCFDYLCSSTPVTNLSALRDTAMPVNGAVVTSVFGSRQDPVTGEQNAGHHGTDLAAPAGSDIYAYCAGSVSAVGTNAVYGNYVRIDHGGGLSTFYGHMKKVTVKQGQRVSCGESIGIIGSTGKSTGVHLHFEVTVDGTRVDPSPYLDNTLRV